MKRTRIIIIALVAITLSCKNIQASELYTAIMKKNISKVEELLQSGSEANEKDLTMGDSAIFWSVESKDLSILKLLIAYGADIHEKDASNANLLIHAAHLGQNHILSYLLSLGLNPNEQDNFGRTALMWATLNCEASSIKLLLQNGADVKLRDNDGENAAIMLERIERYNPGMCKEAIDLIIGAMFF